jgi:hypothetical protein
MKLLARLVLLITGTLLLAHYLPAGYWLLADQRQRVPMVFYSCMQKDFLLFRSDQSRITRTDAAGKTYEREDFERLLPLDNYLQLYKDNRMPKEIDGIPITPEKLRRERVNVRLKPEVLDSPSVALTPLLEAESGRVRLEMPGDFMRLGDGIEFIDAKSNRVLAEKTGQFKRVFADAGFVFPVRLMGGNPSMLKPYDEGYYLVDASGAGFHLRQMRGEPILKRITDFCTPESKTLWTELKPRYIHVQEQDNHEVRALVISQKGEVYVVTGKDYQLVRLPLQHFDPATMQLTLRGDLLNRLVTVSSPGYVEAVVMDRAYQFVDRYTETVPEKTTRPAGQFAASLFPFTLDLESANSGYLGFRFAWGNRLVIVLNLVLLAALVGWLLMRQQKLRARLPELAAVGVGGIFGMILILLLPRTE